MKLISSNIRFANSKDGKQDWPARHDLLAKILNNYGADLIGTQEGFLPQLQQLHQLLPNYQLVAQHRSWIEERMYPCIFINPEIIEVLGSGDFWLSQTPDIAGSSSFKSSFPRLATWIKAKHIKENFSFLFAVTHLDHILPYTREEQIKVLISEIKKINSEKLPLILTGDFNEGPEAKVRQILNQLLPNLTDPWQSLSHAEEPSHHHFCPPTADGARIDWFLVDKRFKTQEIFFDKTTEGGIYPSDHFPLKLQIY